MNPHELRSEIAELEDAIVVIRDEGFPTDDMERLLSAFRRALAIAEGDL